VRDVGEELVLDATRLEQRRVSTPELCVRFPEVRVGTAQVVDQPRLLRGCRHLVGDDPEQVTGVGGEGARLGEVERHGAEHALRRLQGKRDDPAKPQLGRHLLPVLE
jgi:hypothetical protein